jgi:integrase
MISPTVQRVDEPLKSETSRRSIPIPRDMAHLLAEAVRLGNGTHVVSDQWGDPAGPWTIERAVRAARTKVGLSGEFRFHDLRHYFASLLIASELDVKVVQARPGTHRPRPPSTPTAIWPTRDDTSRVAVAAVYRERTPSSGSAD